MANNASVKTKRAIKAADVALLLEDLNRTVFRGELHIEAWAEGNWLVSLASATSENRPYNSIPFWLETPRTFETSHKMAGDFMWWVDAVVCSAIRDKYNGRWTDDGIGDNFPITEEIPRTFIGYLRRKYVKLTNERWLKFWPQFELDFTPKPFQEEVRPYLEKGIHDH